MTAPLRKREWLLSLLVVVTGGWMAFDGIHALVRGDFVTPSSGEHAGQLGPWADIVRGVGVDPRSTGFKIVFVAFGLAYLAALTLYLLRRRHSMQALAALAAVTVLYLPVGTFTGVVILATMFSLRGAAGTRE